MASRTTTLVALFGYVPAILIGALINLPWEKSITHHFGRDTYVPGQDDVVESEHSIRTSVRFPSHGETIHAWLYMPKHKEDEKPPVIVMGHGMGVQKDIGLPVKANAFAAVGIAVLAIDYRNFGGSDGLPRNLISWRRHLEDWAASVEYVKATGVEGQVDPNRIGLWGSSYAGGHSLVTAARFGNNVSAVVAMEPFLFGNSTRARQHANNSKLQEIRMVSAAMSDWLRAKLGLSPTYLPMVEVRGAPGVSLGRLDLLDYNVMFDSVPKRPLGGWKNLVPARIVFDYMGYMPIQHVPNIKCPTLLVAGGADKITPPDLVRRAAALLPSDIATYSEYKNETHFSLYNAPGLEEEMAAFFRKHLRVGGGPGVVGRAAEAVGGAGVVGQAKDFVKKHLHMHHEKVDTA